MFIRGAFALQNGLSSVGPQTSCEVMPMLAEGAHADLVILPCVDASCWHPCAGEEGRQLAASIAQRWLLTMFESWSSEGTKFFHKSTPPGLGPRSTQTTNAGTQPSEDCVQQSSSHLMPVYICSAFLVE